MALLASDLEECKGRSVQLIIKQHDTGLTVRFGTVLEIRDSLIKILPDKNEDKNDKKPVKEEGLPVDFDIIPIDSIKEIIVFK